MITSERQTLLNFFWSIFAFFSAFLLFSTGMLIIGVLMLELATISISLRLTHMERRKLTAEHNYKPQN